MNQQERRAENTKEKTIRKNLEIRDYRRNKSAEDNVRSKKTPDSK